MILYTKTCLSCTDKKLWKSVKYFAAEHNLILEERRVTKNKQWKDEAENYGVSLPFVLHGKIALSLTEDLKELL